MSVYNCEHCDKWLDNDYFPAEFIEDSKGNEKPVCEDCFVEYTEDESPDSRVNEVADALGWPNV